MNPIPVAERYPAYVAWPHGERVLAFVPERNGAYGAWFIAAFYDGVWVDDSREEGSLPDVTHWLPLPELPVGK